MVHLLCKSYGWKLEYVLSLTRGQINVLTDGMKEVAEIRQEAQDDVKAGKGSGRWTSYDKKGNRTEHEQKSASNIFEMAAIPGFVMTPRAQKKMAQIAKARLEKAKLEKEKDGSD